MDPPRKPAYLQLFPYTALHLPTPMFRIPGVIIGEVDFVPSNKNETLIAENTVNT